MFDIDQLIETLSAELPVVFTRDNVAKHLGGILARRTLANLDCKRLGPPSYRTYRKVIYNRETFLPWLRDYLKARQTVH